MTDDVATAVSPGLDQVASAVVAILGGLLLGFGAHAGQLPLLVTVAVVQAALIGSWVFSTGLPGRIGAIVIAAMAAGGADAVVSVFPRGQLGALLPVLGLALPVMFVHQLTRGVVRNRVVESLSDIALLVVAIVALASLIQLRHEALGDKTSFAVALAMTGALVVGRFVDLVAPVPHFDPEVPRGLLAVLGSAIVAGLLGQLVLGGELEYTSGRAGFLGAAVGIVVALLAVGAGFVQQATSLPSTPRAVRLRPVADTLLPIGLAAPVAYLLCLAIHA